MNFLNEKAKSKSQQRLFGMVYAYKEGKLDLDELPKSLADKIKKMADGQRKKTGDKRRKTKGISKSDALDYASTKHDDLPETVKENIITKFDKFIKENWFSNDCSEEFLRLLDDEKIIIDIFNKYGLSCDEKEHHYNEIKFDKNNCEISVSFTSYALGGELPNNISDIMDKISNELNADSWNFWGEFGGLVVFHFNSLNEEFKTLPGYEGYPDFDEKKWSDYIKYKDDKFKDERLEPIGKKAMIKRGDKKSSFDVFKNPKSLYKFDKECRGIITKNGDLYITQSNDVLHKELFIALFKANIADDMFNLYDEPSKYLTVVRKDFTNNLIISSSYKGSNLNIINFINKFNNKIGNVKIINEIEK